MFVVDWLPEQVCLSDKILIMLARANNDLIMLHGEKRSALLVSMHVIAHFL